MQELRQVDKYIKGVTVKVGLFQFNQLNNMSASNLDIKNTCDNNSCLNPIPFNTIYTITRKEAKSDGELNIKGALIGPEVELCANCYWAHKRRIAKPEQK